jgi:hypothetical protein
MQQHVQDVKNLITRNHRSDSFAAHFGKIIPSNTEKSKIRQHVKIKVDILWKGLPLSCVKTFGTKTCKLCAKERYAILTQLFKDPNGTINKCPEVYGACRHKPRFHRFETTKNVAASADEAEKAERVPGSSSTTTSRTPGSIDSNDSIDPSVDKRESIDLLTPVPPIYRERRKNGLKARFQLKTGNDLPQVTANLDLLPQDLLKDLSAEDVTSIDV